MQLHVTKAQCDGVPLHLLLRTCSIAGEPSQRLSQGLDYVVATAGARGMRVILTLTNYLPAYGGAQQWVHWYGGGTITDFWKRQDIRHAAHPAY